MNGTVLGNFFKQIANGQVNSSKIKFLMRLKSYINLRKKNTIHRRIQLFGKHCYVYRSQVILSNNRVLAMCCRGTRPLSPAA